MWNHHRHKTHKHPKNKEKALLQVNKIDDKINPMMVMLYQMISKIKLMTVSKLKMMRKLKMMLKLLKMKNLKNLLRTR
jgi:hypothetical protein